MTYDAVLRPTPIEVHYLNGVPIRVKREDLCWGFPPLSKARGVWAAIENRPEKSIAVVDTARSLNGQLVATIGLTLGRKVLCGYPVYKATPDLIPGPVWGLRSLGVETIPLKANRQFVMRAEMERILAQRDRGSWFLMPTGLRLPETVEAVETVARDMILDGWWPKTIVVPAGTGTHLAGILRAFAETDVRFVASLGYQRNENTFRRYVRTASGVKDFDETRLRVVNTESSYYNMNPDQVPPFPAHGHYEARAWSWLSKPENMETIDTPIMLWNIGA